MDSRFSVAGQLVLVQSLYAQLCAPLDHVGQHFRDAVSAAEDLRDLESLKRVLIEASGSGSGSGSGTIGDSGSGSDADSNIATGSKAKPPRVSRQPGGRSKWVNQPPRLQVNNLIFSYPKVLFLNNINVPSINADTYTIHLITTSYPPQHSINPPYPPLPIHPLYRHPSDTSTHPLHEFHLLIFSIQPTRPLGDTNGNLFYQWLTHHHTDAHSSQCIV